MFIRYLCAFFGLISLVIVFTTGCSTSGTGDTVKVVGAWDILSPLQRQIIPAYSQNSSSGFQAVFSYDAVESVKKGKADVAFVGRELTPEERTGLKTFTIAYDAVCMIVDANSYNGGEYLQNGRPVRQSAGFQDISTEELRLILTNHMTPYGQRWFWSDGYYAWEQVFDSETGLYSDESEWVASGITLSPTLNMEPGKYDTQTALYRITGVSEALMAESRNNQFNDTKLDAEEEVLSVEYYNGAPFTVGSGDFAFKIGFISRRVVPIALQHVPIKVVSLNGVDPMNDTDAIYNGDYLLSRKIYAVTRQDYSGSATDFINYLVSEEGQQTLVEAGYLAVPGTAGLINVP